jgi:hypothetical protein
VDISFDNPFPDGVVPHVVCTPLFAPGFETAHDTFAVTITTVTNASFSVNVRRVDIDSGSPFGFQTWAQQLRLSYIAIA